jgi:hypothetical protein
MLLLGCLWAQGAGAETMQADSLSPQSAPTPAKASGKTAPSAAAPAAKAKKARAETARGKSPRAPSRYRPDRFAGRAGTYYRVIWGVDDMVVRWGESGEVIRFSYRVLDAAKATVLNDKKNEPALIDPERGVSLVVPSMENIGQLRQSAPPETGKAYWMVFSNKGRLVKRGDHVDVVIGSFRADGLVVD